jgi:hypothetical protein
MQGLESTLVRKEIWLEHALSNGYGLESIIWWVRVKKYTQNKMDMVRKCIIWYVRARKRTLQEK